ncbi:hypothetical protein BJX64DRAFT_263049 [Aspergillus heterothallicus]
MSYTMSPQTQQAKQSDKPKRKPVRRDPEKRRQQNLQAQRKYREKLRERLDRLEELAQTAAAARGIKSPLTVDARPSKAAQAPDESGGPFNSTTTSAFEPSAWSLPAYDASTMAITTSLTTNLEDYQDFASQPYDNLSSLAIWDLPVIMQQPNISPVDVWDTTGYVSQTDRSSALAVPYTTTHIPSKNELPQALSTPDSIVLSSQSDSFSICAPYSTDSPSHVDPSLIFPSDGGSRPRWTTTINCGCSKPHFQIHYPDPKSLAAGDYKIVKFEPAAPAANPYINHLRVEMLCTITAMFQLSEHVGISEEAMCHENTVSPFFRYDAESADLATQTSIVSTVRGSYKKTLKPDLRPNKEQITVKHHPYIDVLPFHELRKNLITRPQDYDEDEFFHDMLFGLVCWGSSGVGQRDRDASTGSASTGTPWDVRSWEGHVWFLKKYWSLLGGGEGELPRQSEWWRSIRGEGPLEIEDLD